MPRGCKICNHHYRDAIDFMIRQGALPREIADAFPGEFSYRTVYRHRENCLGIKDGEQSDDDGTPVPYVPPQVTADDVIVTLDDIDADCKRMYEKALSQNEYGWAESALRTRIATRSLIVNMAKIAAFHGDSPGDKGAAAQEENPPPPFLEGIFETD